MKTFMTMLSIGIFLLTLISFATASPEYTIPISDLDNSHFIDQGFSTAASEVNRSPVTPVSPPCGITTWERYELNSTGFEAKVGIGDSFDYDASGWNNNAGFGISSMPIDGGGMGDLTGFDSYGLVFHNPNTRPIHVNIFMNTGWTDPPSGPTEPDNFYESSWTWLNPDACATLNIDLTSATAAVGPDNTPGVDNLNHVSNIGFQVALPGPDPYPWGQGTGDFSVDVAPTPEPASMLLVVGAWFGMIGYSGVRFARKKRKGRG
jgi:hypothetical protein